MKAENITEAAGAMQNLTFLTERRRVLAETDTIYVDTAATGISKSDTGFEDVRTALLAVFDAKIRKALEYLTALGAEFDGGHGAE